MFQRGDTTYINQRGEVVAKQRSTAIRYKVENSAKLAAFAGQDRIRSGRTRSSTSS